MNPFEHELTDEYSNYFMTAFITVFNRLTAGEKFDKMSFIRAVQSAADDDNLYFPYTFLEKLFKESELLISHEKEYLVSPQKQKITEISTKAEKYDII